MTCRLYPYLALLAAVVSPHLFAQESGSSGGTGGQATHVHGTASLHIQASDQQFQVRFQSPAINIVEFEQTPEGDQQNKRVATAEQNLKDVSKILDLDASAGCELESADVNHTLGGDGSGSTQGSGGQGEGHADFTASYQFNCKNPERLNSFRVNAFRYFKGISVVQVQWQIGPSQGSAELNQSKNEVVLTQ